MMRTVFYALWQAAEGLLLVLRDLTRFDSVLDAWRGPDAPDDPPWTDGTYI